MLPNDLRKGGTSLIEESIPEARCFANNSPAASHGCVIDVSGSGDPFPVLIPNATRNHACESVKLNNHFRTCSGKEHHSRFNFSPNGPVFNLLLADPKSKTLFLQIQQHSEGVTLSCQYQTTVTGKTPLSDFSSRVHAS